MLSYNEITPKKYIVFNNEPYEVLSSNVFRKQKGKPINQTKLKSLSSDKVIEHTFHQSESVEEADITKSMAQFIYCRNGVCWLCEPGNPKNRFSIEEQTLESILPFLKESAEITLLLWNDTILSAEMPIKVELAVTQAPPAIKGNTAQGGTKQVELETGATITAPLFIETGDIVRINTQTGEYTERVTKA